MEQRTRKRTIDEAKYIIKTKDTLRNTALKFNVCKTTVYMDLTTRLPKIDEKLYQQVNEVFKLHNLDKHLKGGEATRLKYKRG